eukprot:TRINITY_DN5900_c0_g1_i1.p1 TRINITY_DN5900_c0_g1~~TRINITY_DN5900_c0_g1_i1.p1  ORF type:complete len:1007 (-),score=175.97 TRINITY_DN5900_c0_g1_i1:120-3140(-)
MPTMSLAKTPRLIFAAFCLLLSSTTILLDAAASAKPAGLDLALSADDVCSSKDGTSCGFNALQHSHAAQSPRAVDKRSAVVSSEAMKKEQNKEPQQTEMLRDNDVSRQHQLRQHHQPSTMAQLSSSSNGSSNLTKSGSSSNSSSQVSSNSSSHTSSHAASILWFGAPSHVSSNNASSHAAATWPVIFGAPNSSVKLADSSDVWASLRSRLQRAATGHHSGIGSPLALLEGKSRYKPPPPGPEFDQMMKNNYIGAIAVTLLPFLLVMIETGKKKGDDKKKAGGNSSSKITLKEMSEHTTVASLWLSVDGVVCDLTDFTMLHPGGPDILLQHAGTETSEVFEEIGHSEFARTMVQERAIGLLVDGDAAPRTGAAGAGTLMSRLFTKEDKNNFHKILGFYMLGHTAFRMWQKLNLVEEAGFTTSWLSLASVCVCFILQATSFQFDVPKARLLGSPMIWQEWRAHNMVFVARHILGFTINWAFLRWEESGALNAENFARAYAFLELSLIAALFWQLYTVDVITAWIREDKHTSLTASWPFWDGCPLWLEKGIKFYYTIAQFQASALLIFCEGMLDVNFLVIFPFQFASFLMTLVRKGIITTKGFHAGYLWSLFMVVWLAIGPDWYTWTFSWMFWFALYAVRFSGLSKYGLWTGPLVAVLLQKMGGIIGLPLLPDTQVVKFGIIFATWVVWMAGQRMFMGFMLETRARRFIDARVKPLVLLNRKQVSDSLYHLQFQLPAGYTSGVNPGQHIKIHAPNMSKGFKTWNNAVNLEEPCDELSRSYTPVSATASTTLDLLVRHYPKDQDRGFPQGGRASTSLIERIALGKEVFVSGPHGHQIYFGGGMFLLGKEMKKAKFCGALVGGSGITPVLAVLQDIWQEGRKSIADRDQRMLNEQALKLQEFSLLHVTRTAGEALPDEWYAPPKSEAASPTSTADDYTPIKFHHLVTGTPANGNKVPKRSYGKLTEQMVQAHLPPPSDDVIIMVCGPQGFVEQACAPILQKLGYTQVINLN